MTKIIVFSYQIPHTTKKISLKTTFFQISHKWLESDFGDFWKKSLFFVFFLVKFSILLTTFFSRFFTKIFDPKNPSTELLRRFFDFCYFLWKKCFQSWKDVFFFVFKKKRLHFTTWKGGGNFVHHDFGITNGVVENRLFFQSLYVFKG